MFYNIWRPLLSGRGPLGLALCALLFSTGYAFVEYYIIQDTTFGLQPVLFSLIYPYHFVMAGIFGIAGYFFVNHHATRRTMITAIILTGALFAVMLVVEDFMWFTLRAAAPLHNDANAGRLIMKGEWSTQFLGSVDAHLTAIPNWYFTNVIFAVGVVMMTRAKQQIPVPAAPVRLP